MSAVLLDTDVFSFVMKGNDLALLYDKHLDGKQHTLCFAVVAELLQGVRLRSWSADRVARLEATFKTVTIIPYDIGVCRAWAELCSVKNPDGSKRSYGNNDRWIAACAIHHGIPLISHNRRHFEGTPGLTLISESTL